MGWDGGDKKSQAKPQVVNCGITEKEPAPLGTALQLLPSVCIIGLLYGSFFPKALLPFR